MLSKEAKMVKNFLKNANTCNKSLDEIRQSLKDMKSADKLPEDLDICTINACGVNCELFISIETDDNKIIIYFHGGGYCLGIYNIN